RSRSGPACRCAAAAASGGSRGRSVPAASRPARPGRRPPHSRGKSRPRPSMRSRRRSARPAEPTPAPGPAFARPRRSVRARTACYRPDWKANLTFVSGGSKANGVLELCRGSVENGLEAALVQRALPAAIDDHEQIVARLEDPAEPALQPGDPRLVVVLRQIGPRQVGRGVVVNL